MALAQNFNSVNFALSTSFFYYTIFFIVQYRPIINTLTYINKVFDVTGKTVHIDINLTWEQYMKYITSSSKLLGLFTSSKSKKPFMCPLTVT